QELPENTTEQQPQGGEAQGSDAAAAEHDQLSVSVSATVAAEGAEGGAPPPATSETFDHERPDTTVASEAREGDAAERPNGNNGNGNGNGEIDEEDVVESLGG